MASTFTVYGCCETIQIQPSEYSDGATKVNFPVVFQSDSSPRVYVDARIKDSIGLVALPSITNRIREAYYQAFGNDLIEIHLLLTYIPHARQDRYTGDNAFTFKYSALPLLVAADTDLIIVEDPHSHVSVDLLREAGCNVHVITQLASLTSSGMIKALKAFDYDYVIAPDAGSVERASAMAMELGLEKSDILQLTKSRDPNTGHLTFEPYILKDPSKPSAKAIMFDDIGDGCWTHILAARALRESGNISHVSLVLTHGILSKGVEHLSPEIDEVIILNDWRENTFSIQSLETF